MGKKYFPLEQEFDCTKNKHKFGNIVNLSVVKWDSEYPLMCLYLMQLGEMSCVLCSKVLRLVREGESSSCVIPDGSWESLTVETLAKFNSGRFKEFKS